MSLRWFVSLFRYKNTQKVVNQFLEYVCIETINGCLGIRLLRSQKVVNQFSEDVCIETIIG